MNQKKQSPQGLDSLRAGWKNKPKRLKHTPHPPHLQHVSRYLLAALDELYGRVERRAA